MKNSKGKFILFITILLLGAFFRLYQLSTIAPGFFCDEASIGVNAYTMLTQGTDEYGTPHPLFFRAFGEYKSPVATYSTIPFLFFFGLTETAVRLQAVWYGLLGIVAIGVFTFSLVRKEKYATSFALLAAFFLAISPWHIQFSRVSLEGLTAYVFFTTLGCGFFFLSRKQAWYLIGASLAFVLAIYSYFPARIFVPLLGVSLVFLFWKELVKTPKQVLIALAVGVLLLFPLGITTLSGTGVARFQQVSIFAHPPQDGSVLSHILNNYFSHFSPDFLFFTGDIGMKGQFITRHSVKGMGELYLFQLPLILLGIWYLWKKKHRKELLFLLFWLLLAPTGSMLTLDTSAQATRSIIMVIPWQILSAIGLGSMLVFFQQKNRLLFYGSLLAITCLITASCWNYAIRYFVEYPTYAANFWGWQYGARDIVQTFEQQEQKYDEEIMAPEFNAPSIFFRFYAPHDCQKCHIGLPDTAYNPTKKQLFALTPDYLNSHPQYQFQTKKTIWYPNHTVAFYIGEIVQ